MSIIEPLDIFLIDTADCGKSLLKEVICQALKKVKNHKEMYLLKTKGITYGSNWCGCNKY